MKKADSLPSNSNGDINAFPKDKHCDSVCSKSTLCVLCHTKYEKECTQPKFNKMTFRPSSRTFLRTFPV
jgi:hypothetical protein